MVNRYKYYGKIFLDKIYQMKVYTLKNIKSTAIIVFQDLLFKYNIPSMQESQLSHFSLTTFVSASLRF